MDMLIEHPRMPLGDKEFEVGGFADHATPLIRNCWYMAALSSEVSRDIISRRLLGVDVALYRTEAGAPVAVRNRCPHRSFPLAKGKLVGDTLVCGYHGMQFDPSGRCVNMPSMPIVPTNAQVRSFDVVEHAPLIWIWMGDPDKADRDLIPGTQWLSDPAWKSVRGQFHMKSDYVSMHENLLDQTHFPFLHPGAVGTPDLDTLLNAAPHESLIPCARLNPCINGASAGAPEMFISWWVLRRYRTLPSLPG